MQKLKNKQLIKMNKTKTRKKRHLKISYTKSFNIFKTKLKLSTKLSKPNKNKKLRLIN